MVSKQAGKSTHEQYWLPGNRVTRNGAAYVPSLSLSRPALALAVPPLANNAQAGLAAARRGPTASPPAVANLDSSNPISCFPKLRTGLSVELSIRPNL